MQRLFIRLHFTCPLKIKLLGKPWVEARRHAVRRLADRYGSRTVFSRAAAGAGKEKRADGQRGLEPHSATDSAS